MVCCRVRSYEVKTRCFRCLSYGHIARECTGPGRSKECRRCGIEGHFAKDCEASHSEALVSGRDMLNGGADNISKGRGVTAEITNDDRSPINQHD